ncbi:MAG: alpha/beta hydrolase [Deltaproteobacteria bacterium]|nr:alpha/beta hydrolase [Deltaproteobacteria bacterium]MBW2361791.1 alpha/beta hydrolase [Deltaproteobacteria bacterium]
MAERAYDPEIAPLVPLMPSEMDWSDIAAARDGIAKLFENMGANAPQAREDVTWEDRQIPGPEDAPDVTVRVYRPPGAAGRRPGVLYIHGGGFCVGTIESEHASAAGLCADVDAVVASVEYRLAPEDPFPAGLEDCYAALQWLHAEAASLDIDSAHIGIIGQSAGGGLSAGLALLARDRGGPAICYQVLGIPELDDRLETASMQQFTDTPLWNRPSAIMSWKHYLGENPGAVSPYAAPARRKDLSGLPPAYVATMEFDPLRDEGIQYAMRLLEHGVSVELHQFPGTFHGSSMVSGAEVSKRSVQEMADALRRGLRR